MSFLMWLFQTTLRSYITAPRTTRQISHKSFPSPSAEKKKYYNNRFVFQRRGSGALQLRGNDKYLHAGPKEGQATAAPLS